MSWGKCLFAAVVVFTLFHLKPHQSLELAQIFLMNFRPEEKDKEKLHLSDVQPKHLQKTREKKFYTFVKQSNFSSKSDTGGLEFNCKKFNKSTETVQILNTDFIFHLSK